MDKKRLYPALLVFIILFYSMLVFSFDYSKVSEPPSISEIFNENESVSGSDSSDGGLPQEGPVENVTAESGTEWTNQVDGDETNRSYELVISDIKNRFGNRASSIENKLAQETGSLKDDINKINDEVSSLSNVNRILLVWNFIMTLSLAIVFYYSITNTKNKKSNIGISKSSIHSGNQAGSSSLYPANMTYMEYMQLSKYIQAYIRMGYIKSEIIESLVKQGWNPDKVKSAFNYTKY